MVFEVLVEAWTLRRKKEQKSLKERRSEDLRIAEGTYSALCSSTRSPEGSGSKGDERRSRHVADQFHEAEIYRPMIQNTNMLKAKHIRR
uniref:Uncharacterized protein n=1 Tax=Solanum tuberosum TaxID=4113 RepID=M1DN72_SOLTU